MFLSITDKSNLSKRPKLPLRMAFLKKSSLTLFLFMVLQPDTNEQHYTVGVTHRHTNTSDQISNYWDYAQWKGANP